MSLPLTLRRDVVVNVEVTPQECARLFALSDTHYQIAFLNALGELVGNDTVRIVEGLSADWWDRQLWSCTHDEGIPPLTEDARSAVDVITHYAGVDAERP